MPHTGCRIAIEWPGKVVEAILRLTNDAPEYLPVGFNHVQLDRLIGQRFTVCITQQTIEDDRFTRAIKIARAKHEKLFAIARRASNVKFR
ncbi:hypothetical protein ExPCM14_02441 [Escherichia coli]|nr:hypothetical protein ExPCM14_02441 [Escherichia coli]